MRGRLSDGCLLLCLTLQLQAGTYIKNLGAETAIWANTDTALGLLLGLCWGELLLKLPLCAVAAHRRLKEGCGNSTSRNLTNDSHNLLLSSVIFMSSNLEWVKESRGITCS